MISCELSPFLARMKDAGSTWAVVTALWYLPCFVLLYRHHQWLLTSQLCAAFVLPVWSFLCLSQNRFSARFPLTPYLCPAQLTQQQGALPTCSECPREMLTLVKLGSTSRWASVSCKSPEPSSSLYRNVSGALFNWLRVWGNLCAVQNFYLPFTWFQPLLNHEFSCSFDVAWFSS